jgi:BirA family transcriptional regulator, biotin operon repressor / biotin---[acetyl-CoA-carboxylase] ligase
MDAATLAAAFAARGLPAPTFLAETGSTNADARALAESGAPTGAAVVALAQTQGRGRLGRAWSTSPEGSLALSVVLRPRLPVARIAGLVLAVGVAVAEAIGPPVRLKWPNDLIASDGRKVAGILAEAESSAAGIAFVIVGVGVNVTTAPADLPAVSVAELTGLEPARSPLAAAIVAGILSRVAEVARDPAAVREAWLARDATLGRRVRVGAVEGVAVALGPDGSLEVRDDAGRAHRISAGDVEIVAGLG